MTEHHFLAWDGAKIFYKDWGHGRPIVFLHGWPLTADIRQDLRSGKGLPIQNGL